MGSTNYTNTLIEVAEDCLVQEGQMPPIKEGKKSVANQQFDRLFDQSYELTSDEILFSVHAERKEIPPSEYAEQKEVFFSKGQPCFRASPLTKRYGWGIHSDEQSKVAMFGAESEEYKRLVLDDSVVKVKAMRSKKASA